MVQFFSFFVAAFLGGLLCQKYNLNCRKLTIFGLLITSITLLLGMKISSLIGFILWAIPLGIGGGLVETFGSIMIAQYEKPKSSKLLNLSQVFYCIGAIGAPQIVSAALYFDISWKFIFVFFAASIALITAFFIIFAKNNSSSAQVEISENSHEYSIFKDSLFYLLSAVILIYVTFESMYVCWISAYFEKALLCPVHTSPLRLSVFWFGLIIGRFTVTLIPIRFSFWYVMFIGTAVMFINSLALSFTSSNLIATILVFLAGLGAGPIWPTTVAICHYARNNTTFTSYVIAAGSIGVVLGSWLGMLVVRYIGFGWFFPVITFGCSLLLIAAILTKTRFLKQ
jgi:fucose permease